MQGHGLVRLTATGFQSLHPKAGPCIKSSLLISRKLQAPRSSLSTCFHTSRWTLVPFHNKHVRYSSLQPRLYTTSATGGIQPPKPTRRGLPRWTFYLSFGLVLFAAVTYYNDNDRAPRSLLNKERFTPCLVLSSEPVSPTAFILTVRTPPTTPTSSKDTPTNHDIVHNAWRHGLWSVEIKQPQLQIARNYTPLPPSSSTQAQPPSQHDGAAELRFLIRRYDSGETSTYLSRLRAGDTVELRGPHLGFDVARRLGSAGRDVVFLAGGTGVAPAMQAAARLLEGERDVSVRILWANRAAVDCSGCTRLAGGGSGWLWGWRRTDVEKRAEQTPGEVMRQLRALQDEYAAKGRVLDVKCAVDEEGGFITPRDIANAVASSSRLSTRAGVSCGLHSQEMLVRGTEVDDSSKLGADGLKTSPEIQCTCGHDGKGGKNLLMISGPDGFLSAFVGPKVWADGAERQGHVGGHVAELMKKDPFTWNDWLVLKQ